jgi:F420-non-reducing hydrogenase iron-sulfur subunit
MTTPKVIIITCNWEGYAGFEAVGKKHLEISPDIYPLKVKCLGEISPGILLKAFEKGADGVLLMGCPPDECHYTFGNRYAEEMISDARELLNVLGYREEQLSLDWVAAGDAEDYVTKVNKFIAGLNGNQIND